MEGKVAVVTGAAQGIGAATAQRLARDGYAVAVIDVEETRATETVDAITSAGGRARGFGCDVADEAAVQRTFANVADTLGPVDTLVNNAGIIRDNLLFRMTVEDWDAVMGVHLRGSFLCSREAQQWMVKARWGRIVNVSSVSALGNRGQANYSSAKAGIQGLTRTCAVELGPFGIAVNGVAPGYIDTAMTAEVARRVGQDFEERKAAAARTIPLRRVGVPDDVANVVSFLAGPDCTYVSGQIIYVAGGPRG